MMEIQIFPMLKLKLTPGESFCMKITSGSLHVFIFVTFFMMCKAVGLFLESCFVGG